MKIYVLSDIHLEFYKRLPPMQNIINVNPAEHNVLCLCGDIGYPHRKIYSEFLAWCSAHFTKVFVIAGNHEYYSPRGEYTMEDIADRIQAVCASFPNVSFLNRSTELYGGVQFIGATLWSDLKVDTNQHIFRIHHFNDFKAIWHADTGQPLTLDEYQALYVLDVTWLDQTLAEASDEYPCIVLTHHLPSLETVHERWRGDPLNFMFASTLDGLICHYGPKIQFWLAGHTHMPTTTVIGNTVVVVNPIGYPGERVRPIWNRVIDLSLAADMVAVGAMTAAKIVPAPEGPAILQPVCRLAEEDIVMM
jgi:predicted phosphodiesterase